MAGKSATLLLNAICSSVAKQVARFCCPFFRTLYTKKSQISDLCNNNIKERIDLKRFKHGALTIGTEISVKNFRQMVLAPKTGTGLSCTIYKIPVNFLLSLDMKPGTGNPNKWYRKFRSFR